MTLKEEDAIHSLEKRINDLYSQVFSTKANDSSGVKKSFEVLEDSKSTLKEIESRHSVVKQLWKKLPQLEEYLSVDFMDKLGVTEEVKTTLILASEENLKMLTKQLTELQTLQNVINNPVLKDVPEHSKKLEPIIQLHLDQKDETEIVNERIQNLLAAYNNIISTLSKQFVLWNNLVTQCELALDKNRDAIE